MAIKHSFRDHFFKQWQMLCRNIISSFPCYLQCSILVKTQRSWKLQSERLQNSQIQWLKPYSVTDYRIHCKTGKLTQAYPQNWCIHASLFVPQVYMYQMSAVQKTWTTLYWFSVTALTPNQDWTTGLSKTGDDFIMSNKAQPCHFHSVLRKSELCIYAVV